ncbi:hypothetical protein [Peribacillus sp. JNUCC41]|uniref:spr1630 family ClpXP-sensitive toxin n=1 Tax=Peribacillus sp. JNUCC41 TaxID=2778370 RepID=UPI001786718E|nr:hypothetical protein [Brevibacillus sp. JNUCC-41]QOS92059.1 hypothetical protein JNUCC41_10655 [Brevibacillus sp. JNUCC-41]
MENFKFSDELNLKLVRGIEKGYSSYAEERRAKRKEMKISSAYAWVKGNHIDHHVAEELEEIEIDFIKSKAGYTWGYLQFNDSKEKNLFLIKNANVIKNKLGRHSLDTQNSDHYIVKLTHVNTNVDFKYLKKEEQGALEFLDLSPVIKSIDDLEVEELKMKFNKFYILTYSIDDENRMLSDISLWMPEFQGDSKVELYKVDSLNDYLGNSGISVNEEAIKELQDIPEEEFSGNAEQFGYTVIDGLKENEE